MVYILAGIGICGVCIGFVVIYKKSWFLKLHVHNVIGYLYDFSRLIKGNKDTKRPDEHVQKANAKKPLRFKSYINDTQNVHPKVLYFSEGFSGHKFWMVYTPFPWYIDRYENPCIAFSDDGYQWSNISGNPIDDPQGNGYDSDAHLVYHPEKKIIECWYRHVGAYSKPPVGEVLHRRTSADGIHWSEDEVLFGNYSGSYARLLSPAILFEDGKYQIWTINQDNDYHVEYRESSDGHDLTMVRDFELNCRIQGDPLVYKPWHLDVIRAHGKYIMLIMCKEEKESGARSWNLFLSCSEDNITYSEPELVLHGSHNGWDSNIYRATIVNVERQYRIYYSALNRIGKHGLGITQSNHLRDFEGWSGEV